MERIVLEVKVRFFVLAPEALVLRMTRREDRFSNAPIKIPVHRSGLRRTCHPERSEGGTRCVP
jgi:hypothetical protein